MSAFKPSVDIEFSVVDEKERAAARKRDAKSSSRSIKDKSGKSSRPSSGKVLGNARDTKVAEKKERAPIKKPAKKVSIAPTDGAHYGFGQDTRVKSPTQQPRESRESQGAVAEAKESSSSSPNGKGKGNSQEGGSPTQQAKQGSREDREPVAVAVRPAGGVSATKVSDTCIK